LKAAALEALAALTLALTVGGVLVWINLLSGALSFSGEAAKMDGRVMLDSSWPETALVKTSMCSVVTNKMP
jgi:hypothetical protein